MRSHAQTTPTPSTQNTKAVSLELERNAAARHLGGRAVITIQSVLGALRIGDDVRAESRAHVSQRSVVELDGRRRGALRAGQRVAHVIFSILEHGRLHARPEDRVDADPRDRDAAGDEDDTEHVTKAVRGENAIGEHGEHDKHREKGNEKEQHRDRNPPSRTGIQTFLLADEPETRFSVRAITGHAFELHAFTLASRTLWQSIRNTYSQVYPPEPSPQTARRPLSMAYQSILRTTYHARRRERSSRTDELFEVHPVEEFHRVVEDAVRRAAVVEARVDGFGRSTQNGGAMASKKRGGPSLSTRVLIQIRDEVRTTNERLSALERRQTETEVRLASELVAVARAVTDVRDLLRDDLALRHRVDDHEQRLAELERKVS